MKTINELINLLNLETLGDSYFKGISKTVGSPNVFGGQVLAQSLNAGNKTVPEDRILHSLHAYFLEPGNLEAPVFFKVENVRDGRSFSTRRVKAIQNNITIFILAASFHKKQEGFEHQKEIKKDLKQPESLLSWDDILVTFNDSLSDRMKAFLSLDRPIEFKPTVIPNPNKDSPPVEDVWFRLKGTAKQKIDLPLKQQILTYISDYNILRAVLKPHTSKMNTVQIQSASLDHSMWFFRDFDFDDWMLFSAESPNSFGARGLAIGNIFTRNGELIASLAQEGLMRLKKT